MVMNWLSFVAYIGIVDGLYSICFVVVYATHRSMKNDQPKSMAFERDRNRERGRESNELKRKNTKQNQLKSKQYYTMSIGVTFTKKKTPTTIAINTT